MSPRTTPTRLIPILLLLLLLHTLLVQAETRAYLEEWWHRWSGCELDCHIDVWYAQNCSTANSCGEADGCLSLSDTCLCVTPAWVTAVYRCIGRECGPSGVYDAANMSSTGCLLYAGVDNIYTPTELIDIGLAANSTNSTAAATFSPTQTAGKSPQATIPLHSSETSDVPATPANTNTGDPGLSTTSQIVIGVVVPVTIALLGWLGKILVSMHTRRQKKKEKTKLLQGLVPADNENSRPLLNNPDSSQGMSGSQISPMATVPIPTPSENCSAASSVSGFGRHTGLPGTPLSQP